MTTPTQQSTALDVLGRDGALTMLALDQRGSLRTILSAGGSEDGVSDDDIRAFKRTAVDALADMASAVLLDDGFGNEAIDALPGSAPLILSADVFEQPPGGFVERSRVDDSLTVDRIHELGAAALKLLLIWKPTVDRGFRAEQVSKIIALARAAGVVSLVEGIVRTDEGERFPTADEHGAAVVQAAKELTELGPDIYKAEVPGYMPGDLSRVEEYAREITAALRIPWVVLSNGVESQDFAEAVRLSVRGGANGFLAGRAIWADAAAGGAVAHDLRTISRTRLEALAELVRKTRDAV